MRTWPARYAIAAATFTALIWLPRGIRALFGVSFDTTFLVILAMVASAWYLGRGPGLMMAAAFEVLLDYHAPWPPPNRVRFVVVACNRILLFASVVWFASSRRAAEERLKTQRRELEETLVREQEARADAENANRLKDEFLATVSHELRTPLNAVLGWATLLTRHSADEETRTRALAAIERGARAQAQIVNDILDVSRFVTGGLRIERNVVALAPVVREAIDTVGQAVSAKQLTLTISLDETAFVMGDAQRLRQVTWNLLSNAIKFTPPTGRIDVWLGRVDGHAEIRVHDSGIGIPPEFFPNLFQRFSQADASMTREQGGLGLGLSIVRHIVELHGGTVTAHSGGVGQGSTFIVRLPLTARPAASGRPSGAERQGAVFPR